MMVLSASLWLLVLGLSSHCFLYNLLSLRSVLVNKTFVIAVCQCGNPLPRVWEISQFGKGSSLLSSCWVPSWKIVGMCETYDMFNGDSFNFDVG